MASLSKTTLVSISTPIGLLKPGMIPEELIYMDKDVYRKAPLANAPQLPRKMFPLGNMKEGLTYNSIRELKRMERRGMLSFSSIKVKKTLPFAPFMFLGVLLTIASSGAFLIYFF